MPGRASERDCFPSLSVVASRFSEFLLLPSHRRSVRPTESPASLARKKTIKGAAFSLFLAITFSVALRNPKGTALHTLPVPATEIHEFAPAFVRRHLEMTATRQAPCRSRQRGQRRARGAAKAAASSSFGVFAAMLLLFFFSCLASLGGARAQPQILAAMTLTVSFTI